MARKLSTKQLVSLYGGEREDDEDVDLPVKSTPERILTPSIEKERLRRWLDSEIEKSKEQESSCILMLTVPLAELLMERNTQNRKQSPTNLRSLIRDASEGRYVFNGQSVVLTQSGVLADGQHRCETVLKTNIPIKIVLVFGITDDARLTIDTGKTKSAGDFLGMMGVENAKIVAQVASLIWQWKTHNKIANSALYRPTKTQNRRAAMEYAGLQESIEFCRVPGVRSVATVQVMAMCHWAFCQSAGREAADHFVTKVIKGDYRLSDSNPIAAVRARLMKIKGGAWAHERVCVLFKAWNLHRRGESAGNLRLTATLPELES